MNNSCLCLFCFVSVGGWVAALFSCRYVNVRRPLGRLGICCWCWSKLIKKAFGRSLPSIRASIAYRLYSASKKGEGKKDTCWSRKWIQANLGRGVCCVQTESDNSVCTYRHCRNRYSTPTVVRIDSIARNTNLRLGRSCAELGGLS